MKIFLAILLLTVIALIVLGLMAYLSLGRKNNPTASDVEPLSDQDYARLSASRILDNVKWDETPVQSPDAVESVDEITTGEAVCRSWVLERPAVEADRYLDPFADWMADRDGSKIN